MNNNGWSALIWCAINGCEEAASTLLGASANYLTADHAGRTAARPRISSPTGCSGSYIGHYRPYIV